MLNTQGYGTTFAAGLNPDLISNANKPRMNTDNNGRLFINPSPNYLYNFSISDDFLRNGIVEFELIFDIGNAWKNENNYNQYFNEKELEIIEEPAKVKPKQLPLRLVPLNIKNEIIRQKKLHDKNIISKKKAAFF